jgi:nanoRNase/pAp phosphatase (c-di-AMP/oligoRNAs hydrolase)
MKQLTQSLLNLVEPIAIVGNKIPDGDSVGSIVAVADFLRRNNRSHTVLFSQFPVDTLEWMLDEIDNIQMMDEVDLSSFRSLVVLDDIFNTERLGLPEDFHGHVLTIDHHISNKEKHVGKNVFWEDVPATACVLINQGIFHPFEFVSLYTDTVSFTRRTLEVLPYVLRLQNETRLSQEDIEKMLLNLQGGMSFDSLKSLFQLEIWSCKGVLKETEEEIIALIAVSKENLDEHAYRLLIGTLRRYSNFTVLINRETRKSSVRNETSLDALGLVSMWDGGGHRAACGMTLGTPVGKDLIKIQNWLMNRIIIHEIFQE